MANQRDSQEMVLDEFLASAARSFNDAQKLMLKGSDISASMMLSSAELEVKVAVDNANGRMKIRPISLRDIREGGIDSGMLSTLRINYVGSVDELSTGGLSEGATPETNDTPTKKRVPDLTDLTLKEATDRLKANKWKFVAHAANREEIALAGETTHGKVIRQQPEPLEESDTDTIHFWVNLGSVSVQTIDGIGEKMASKLSKAGIRSIGDLSLANVSELSSFLRIDEQRTRDFINMASMMSRLVVFGLKDEIVELLVKGANIYSIEDLAQADPIELYKACSEILTKGKIMTPKEFSFTQKDVEEWISVAKRSL